MQRAQSLLQLWQACNNAHAEAAARLEPQERKYQQIANINTSGNNLAEVLPPALQDAKVGLWGKPRARQPDGQGHDQGVARPQGGRGRKGVRAAHGGHRQGGDRWAWESQAMAHR